MSTPVVLSDHAIEQLAKSINSVTITSSSLDLPAWVQAIGSIAAIVAAFIIARAEARRLRRERVLADAEMIETIAHHWKDALTDVTYMAENGGEFLANVTGRDAVTNFLRSELDDLRNQVRPPIDKLAELPLTAWPNIGMGLNFYRFQADLAGTFMTLERVLSAEIGSDLLAFRAAVKEYTASIEATASAATATFEAYQHTVTEFHEETEKLGGETRLVRRKRLAERAKIEAAALKAEAELEGRENERRELISRYPPARKRTAAETSRLESLLALNGLDPLRPLSPEEKQAEEDAEAEAMRLEEADFRRGFGQHGR